MGGVSRAMTPVVMDPVTIPQPKVEWRGGPRAVGRMARDPGFMVGKNQDSRVPRRVALYNPIPGYTGRNAQMPTEVSWNNDCIRQNNNMPFSTDDAYAKASPRIKTNSKNISTFAMGDNRCRYWNTTNTDLIKLPDGYEESTGQSIVDNWETKTPEEHKVIYRRAMSHVGQAGVTQMFEMVRAKIEQRTTGGPFVLRQAFKLFDKDASGDIDPDEFYGAMEFMGLQFTERQVIALFGMCDDDGGGALDYYEFIEKVLDGIACRPQSAAKRVYPKAVNVYRQQLAIGALFSQIEKKDKDATFEVDRLTIRELLDMAHTRRDGTHNEMEGHIDLVQDTIQLLAQGSISQSEFWNWWIGTTSICGIADFPVCDSYERSDFESVQSKTMDLRLKPVPPGA